MNGRPLLTRAQLQQHRVTVPGVKDSIWNPLYDYQTYANAGVLSMTFFSNPIGSGTTSAPGASGSKTQDDTNMVSSSQLAQGNEFYCTAVEFLFWPGIEPGRGAIALANVGLFADDVWTLLKSGTLTLTVQQRNYVQDSPLGKFPPANRMTVQSAVDVVADTNATAAPTVEEIVYATGVGMIYQIVPVYIVSNQNFNVTVNWPAVVALPSATDGRVGVRLRGYLIRDAQ